MIKFNRLNLSQYNILKYLAQNKLQKICWIRRNKGPLRKLSKKYLNLLSRSSMIWKITWRFIQTLSLKCQARPLTSAEVMPWWELCLNFSYWLSLHKFVLQYKTFYKVIWFRTSIVPVVVRWVKKSTWAFTWGRSIRHNKKCIFP